MANSSPIVPVATEMQKIFLSSKDAPIRSVVVFIHPQNKVEITRVISITPKMLGVHEVPVIVNEHIVSYFSVLELQ